jgi:hypothetical protein
MTPFAQHANSIQARWGLITFRPTRARPSRGLPQVDSRTQVDHRKSATQPETWCKLTRIAHTTLLLHLPGTREKGLAACARVRRTILHTRFVARSTFDVANPVVYSLPPPSFADICVCRVCSICSLQYGWSLAGRIPQRRVGASGRWCTCRWQHERPQALVTAVVI